MSLINLQRNGSQSPTVHFPPLPATLRTGLINLFSQSSYPVLVNCWEQERFWSGNPDPSRVPIILNIHHPGVFRALIQTRDPLILVEAYLQGAWDFEGSGEALIGLFKDLSQIKLTWRQALKLGLQSLTLPELPGLRRVTTAQAATPHTLEQDQRAIQHHYDVGNDFYRLWLDPLMVYSCAYFPTPETSLEIAQQVKLDIICRKLQLQPGDFLLDIGCGWGALLHWATTHYGVQGLGITLSREQYDHNQRWIGEQGLGDRLQVQLLDYRDLPDAPRFNKIVSVGMIEHVGAKNYPVYFRKVFNLLKPGGLFLNHGINATTEWHNTSLGERFIDRYIFPHGELVPLSTTLTAAEKAGWEIVDVDGWRPHYALTLRHWAARLEQNQEQAAECLGDRRVQLWRIYLLGSALGFETNEMNIYQTLLRRRTDQSWNLPITRQHWLC